MNGEKKQRRRAPKGLYTTTKSPCFILIERENLFWFFFFLERKRSSFIDQRVLKIGENARSTTNRSVFLRRARLDFTKIRKSTPQTNVTVLTPKGRPRIADNPVANALAILVIGVNHDFFAIPNKLDCMVHAPAVVFTVSKIVLHDTSFVPLPVACGN